MHIDSIKNGVVIDHIKAGQGMEIYHFLGLDKLDCPIAIIKNAASKRMGSKDIIKVNTENLPDLKVLGYIDPDITINVIKDGERVAKYHPEMPEKIVNIVKCKNPRCITTVEGALDQHFILKDRARGVYRCMFCDAERKSKALR